MRIQLPSPLRNTNLLSRLAYCIFPLVWLAVASSAMAGGSVVSPPASYPGALWSWCVTKGSGWYYACTPPSPGTVSHSAAQAAADAQAVAECQADGGKLIWGGEWTTWQRFATCSGSWYYNRALMVGQPGGSCPKGGTYDVATETCYTHVCPEHSTGPNNTSDGKWLCYCDSGYDAVDQTYCVERKLGKEPRSAPPARCEGQGGEGSPPMSPAPDGGMAAGGDALSGMLFKGNPVNAGTGTKLQAETIYVGSGPFPLMYRLNYASPAVGSNYVLSAGHGASWISNYGRRVTPEASASEKYYPWFVTVRRTDGRQFVFNRVTNYGLYLADADIRERFSRQVDSSGITTGWTVEGAEKDIETYDPAGRLVKLTDRRGLAQTLTYDGAGRLAAVTDAFGRSLVFAYDPQDRVATLTQPDNGVVAFAYDGAGNLAGITWPDSKIRQYHYEDARFPNHLTGITDENGNRFATWSYDEQGRAVTSEHAGGAERTTLSYGTGSTTVTDALGAARSLSLTTVLNVVRPAGESQPGGAGCGPAASSLTYDANGNVASRTDFNGVKTTYLYDSMGRNLEAQRVEAYGTPQARKVSTSWHATYPLPLKVAEPLKLTTFSYDGQGNLLSRTEQATSDATGGNSFFPALVGLPHTWTWTYNSLGQVLTEDGPLAGSADVTTTTYYSADDADLGKRGQVATVTNALGHVTQVTAYDANGRPLSVTDPNNVITSLAYDGRGRLTSRTVGGEITSYEYDGVGKLLKVSLPDGGFLAYTYDAAQRLTWVADGQGNRIAYTLDAAGNRLKEEVTDPQGNLVRLRQRAFDVLGRLSQETSAAGHVTSYAYDANGNLTGVTDPLNRLSSRSYDALNRLIKLTDPAGGVTGYVYDGRSQLTQVSDPRSLITKYTVDGLGQQTALQSPDTGTAKRSYDEAGRVVSGTDAKGQTTTYTYDLLGRLQESRYADGSRGLYSYDAGPNGVGRLTQVEERNAVGAVTGSQQYAYDALGRVTGETRLVGSTLLSTAYRYSQGRLAGLTYPSGRQVDYQYDTAGRVSRITLTNGADVTILADAISYQPFGGVVRFTNGAGQSVQRSYDQDGRATGFTLGNVTWSLGYDAAGRLTSQQDNSPLPRSGNYAYDLLDRLTDAVVPTTWYGYSYDANGNRTASNAGAGNRSYNIAATSNRLLAIGGSEAKSYQYDANGSPTSDGGKSFTYDARGRLKGVTTGQGSTAYVVNAQGQRTKKSASSGTTLYTYDLQGHLLAEAGDDGTVKREYVWLGDIPLAVLY